MGAQQSETKSETKSESKSESKITIRIPAEIAQMLRRLAKQHDRSLNGEIVRALREYAARHNNEKQP